MSRLEVQFSKKLKSFTMDMEFSMDGECLGILGASGSGKSMTLKAIAGIVTPDSGRIQANGRVLFDKAEKKDLPPRKRKVGYLFQNYALFPNMTVAENIGAGMRGSKAEKKRKIAEMTERFHLSGLENQYPYRLSGGQQQRTALARILASEPDVLLLDEPFSALDSYLKEELQLELREHLKQFSGSTIIVSHDRDEIYRLCDRTMIVEEGCNRICKDTKELFLYPEKTAAARLTGCKNISKAVKTGENRVRALEWGVELTVAGRIPENLSTVGIRAHDFLEVPSQDTAGKGAGESGNSETDRVQKECNCFPVVVEEEIKSPFERTVLFRNAANPAGSMWMKMDDVSRNFLPWMVEVKPEKILLLTD